VAHISYSHMRQLAQDHGQAGWHAHAFPLSVDGLEIVASLVLLADRRAGRKSGWLPWAALAIGTAGSLAANVAAAGPAVISQVIAGWPALALLIAVKLLSGMLDQPAPSPRASAILPSPSADGTTHAAAPSRTAPRDTARQSSGRPAPPGSHADRPAPAAPAVLPHRERGPARALPDTDSGTDPPGAGLLPAARAARDALRQGGEHLTGDALAARLRQNGHPVRNSRLTPLLRALRDEPPAQPPAGIRR
jgi:hypothetical protein